MEAALYLPVAMVNRNIKNSEWTYSELTGLNDQLFCLSVDELRVQG